MPRSGGRLRDLREDFRQCSFYESVANTVDVSFSPMLTRMLAAMVCGGIIGLDRELRGNLLGLAAQGIGRPE
ncbi:MAG: hypothetical protein WEA84_14505 [Rhodovibrionaceae bacterium]